MATIAKTAITPVSTVHGGPPEVRHFPEGATQSFVAGELVTLTAGLLVEAADAAATFVGVAAEDASGTTGTEIAVYTLEGTIFGINMLEDAIANHTSAASDLGTVVGTQRDTSAGEVYLDTDETITATAVPIGYQRGSEEGDVNARVLVKFTTAADLLRN